jgi:hypothetical protein
MSNVADLLIGLVEHLRNNVDEFIKKKRINVVRKRVGYSEWTNWDTTVSFDEIQTVDYEELLVQIDDFAKTFKDKE